MKKNSLANSLEIFMKEYYDYYNMLGSQILSDMMENRVKEDICADLFVLLDQDKSAVIDQLQKSDAVNKTFFQIKNDFVENLMKNLKEFQFLRQEEKRELHTSVSKNKEVSKLISELGLSDKKKATLKKIIELSVNN